MDNPKKGYIISVQGPVVDVRFDSEQDIPGIYENINTETVDGKRVILEVAEHLQGNIARCISINSTFNLQRNAVVICTGSTIEIPAGDSLYGRIINVWGDPIDQKGEIPAGERLPIRGQRIYQKVSSKTKSEKFEVLETGIKIIDLLYKQFKCNINDLISLFSIILVINLFNII